MSQLLGALAGGDAIQILVMLKDLTAVGAKQVEGEIGSLETKANATNFSGFSKASKGLKSDAEAAAGDAEKGAGGGAGGLASLAGGFGLLLNPATLAVAAIAGVTAVMIAAVPTYQVVEQRLKQLDIALKDHGESYTALKPAIDAAVTAGEAYGFNANDTEGAITSLTEANLNWAQVQAAMPHIMDLAIAKNISLADAADAYSKAVYGNAKILKQYGVILPAVSASAADTGKATTNLQKAQDAASVASQQLAIVQTSLQGKTTLTAAETLKLQQAQDKVRTTSDALTAAQDKLGLAQQGGVDKAARLTLLNNDLAKAIGGQQAAVTPLQVVQAKLSDTWEHFSTVVGPVAEKVFTTILTVLANVIDGISTLIGTAAAIAGWVASLGPVQLAFQVIGNVINTTADIIHNFVGVLQNVAGFFADIWHTVTTGASTAAGQVKASTGPMWHGLTVGAQTAATSVTDSMDRLKGNMVQSAQAAAVAVVTVTQASYTVAEHNQTAHNDAMLTAQDQASLEANNHQIAALNAQTAISYAANKAAAAASNKAGFDAAVAYGTGLRSGQSNVDSGLKQMLSDMKTILSVPKQIAKLEGELASTALAKALRDKRPQVKTDAIALTQSIMDQLTSLGVTTAKLSPKAANALKLALADAKAPTLTAAEQLMATVQGALTANYYTYGYATAQTYVQGIKDSLAGLPNAVTTALGALAHKLHAKSPPTDPTNPLHTIDVMGFNTGDAYAKAFVAGISGAANVHGALATVAGALGTSPSHPFAAGRSGSPGSGNSYVNFYLDGNLFAQAIVEHLDRLFGKRIALMGSSAIGAMGLG